MPRPNDFAGRVNYAAQVISNGRATSRAFDNCFENDDGDEVCAALMRRAEKNKRLADNMPRYLDMAQCKEAAERLAGKDLAKESAATRARSEQAWQEMMRARAERQAQEKAAAGIQA